MGGAWHDQGPTYPMLSQRFYYPPPSSVQKIGTLSTICHNYPAVGIALPYLTAQAESTWPAVGMINRCGHIRWPTKNHIVMLWLKPVFFAKYD